MRGGNRTSLSTKDGAGGHAAYDRLDFTPPFNFVALSGICEFKGVDLRSCLTAVLSHIADHKVHRIDTPLSANVAERLSESPDPLLCSTQHQVSAVWRIRDRLLSSRASNGFSR